MDAMNREALTERMHAHEESLIELRREAVKALAQILMLCDRMEAAEKRVSHLEARGDDGQAKAPAVGNRGLAVVRWLRDRDGEAAPSAVER